MAVPCQHCGREYDVALFEFGRTIWCTCGNRVGIEPRVRRLGDATQQRFAADAMLGRLARWLRLLGFDCTHDPEIKDEAIVRLAVSEGRTILTRDRRLPEEWWIHDVYLVREQEVRKQLVEVIGRFDLVSSIRILTRCSACNRVLERVERSAVADRVPPRALELQEVFAECRECGRVYWEGSHAARIRALVERLVAGA
jgi:uncharacterized protein with PIN domain